jgi:hypothetical protein
MAAVAGVLLAGMKAEVGAFLAGEEAREMELVDMERDEILDIKSRYSDDWSGESSRLKKESP